MELAPAGVIVDLLGFLTGATLYVMLVAMVWRERAADGRPFFSARGRLPLLTGVCGLVWNVGAMWSFGSLLAGDGAPWPPLVVMAFSALGFLPAVVVHGLLEGRETAAGRTFIRGAIVVAYALSVSAAVLHTVGLFRGLPVPSRLGLWVLTAGFIGLTGLLLLVTRQQAIGRRGVWVAALSVFAVSALHFGSHGGNEPWPTGLAGHHASLLLALAILHQDYRFALADLFLKNAIALLLLMSLTLGAFFGAVLPLLEARGAGAEWDPVAVIAVVALWLATALAFPLLRRAAGRIVDRLVLRRPDYGALLGLLADRVDRANTEGAIVREVSELVRRALGAADAVVTDDPLTPADGTMVVTHRHKRARTLDGQSLVLRLRPVDPPYPAIAFGPLAAGRRLLSDEEHWLESVARLASRRLDSVRVANERLARDSREREMQRLAAEAELRALRAQLNPHFLFNALATIAYLIEQAPARALDTLMQLSSVLRAVLRRSAREFSTLADEIEVIRAYLDIERARFEERLAVTIEVPPDVLRILVPTLLLQPLVENAVKHGIAPQRHGGAIRITATRDRDLLKVAIDDSGTGFDLAAAQTTSGVGLRSVADRLRAHYGESGLVHVGRNDTGGARVELTLPAVTAGDLARKAV
jgi:two-component system LytT family sensor kinase